MVLDFAPRPGQSAQPYCRRAIVMEILGSDAQKCRVLLDRKKSLAYAAKS